MSQQININELKPHSRNNEFFDDITGSNWEQFLDSMRERIKNGKTGNVEPIVITQDKVIVSGHQRVRGLKELKIIKVDAEIKIYESDDEVLADLIETNIRQRGIGNPNPMKLGRCIKELERIYGIKQGGSGFYGNQHKKNEELRNNFVTPKTEKDLADEIGLDVRTLQNYKKLTEMIPELEELVDTGITTPTTALAIMRNLSEEEQLEMISSLDTTKKITQKQVQTYIDEIKLLKKENKELKDYTSSSATEKISNLKTENERLENENRILEAQKKISDDLANQYKSQSEEYMEVKKKLAHMGLEPDGDYNTFNATVQITELNNQISDLLENKLAPLKYKPYMFAVKSNDLLKKNFMNTLSLIYDWYSTMLSYIGEENYEENIIDIEMEEN